MDISHDLLGASDVVMAVHKRISGVQVVHIETKNPLLTRANRTNRGMEASKSVIMSSCWLIDCAALLSCGPHSRIGALLGWEDPS